jgi:hypothetical protein
MQMPLVSKFLCYLEAAARRELAGNPETDSCFRGSLPPTPYSFLQWVSARRGSLTNCSDPIGWYPLLISAASLVVVEAKAIHVAFCRNKNPQTHSGASLLVPMESGRGGFESLLEHDSKAQLPFVYPLGLYT